MSGIANFFKEVGNVLSFGYDATVDKSRRGRPVQNTRHEDNQLLPHERTKAIATQRDQLRNLSWVQWMVNKHLDYVSQFHFRGTSQDDALNEKIEDLMDEWAQPENCDIAQRHSLEELMRLYESGKVADGDCAFIKVRGALQGIESDRICKPTVVGRDLPARVNDHGLVMRQDGSVQSYVICKRSVGDMLTFDRIVPARNVFFDGYFKRFDQTRGISPLLTALNNNQDLYENFEYTLLKIKLHSMLGVQVTRQVTTSNDGWDYDSESYTTEGGGNGTEYQFDMLNPGSKIEMDPGDEIKTIESNTPSNEFMDYSELIMRIAFLTLDIPFTMFNSKQSNNNAMRNDLRQYFKSARRKQRKNQRVLNNITTWKLQQWLVSGKITLAEFRAIQYAWVPSGMPIIDPGTEVRAYSEEIAAGLNSRTQIARERGLSQRQIFRDLQREEEEIKDLGITGIAVGQPGQNTIGQSDNNAKPEPVDGMEAGFYMVGNELVHYEDKADESA